jgi:hypothetical protein
VENCVIHRIRLYLPAELVSDTSGSSPKGLPGAAISDELVALGQNFQTVILRIGKAICRLSDSSGNPSSQYALSSLECDWADGQRVRQVRVKPA